MCRFRLRSSGYGTVFLCLVCGISFSGWGPLYVHAQSLPAPVSLAGDGSDRLDPKRFQNAEQFETSDISPKSQTQSSPQEAAGGSQSPASTETKTEAGKEEKKPAHRGSIVAAPLPISSPALGAGIVPILGYIFPFSRNDKVSPPSVVGAAGLVTNDGSRGFGVGAQLFMKEDTYEITAVYARGNLDTTCTALELPRAMQDSSCRWNKPAKFSLVK
jgi:hypothetical protein